MIITNVFEKKYENNVKCFWKRVFDAFTYQSLVYFCAGDICILGVQESVSGLFWLQYGEVC